MSYLDAGFDDTQHLFGVSGHPEQDEPTLGDTLETWLDVDPSQLPRLAAETARRGMVHTPTLVVSRGYRTLALPRQAIEYPGMRLLPRLFRDALWSPEFRTGWGDLPSERYLRRASEIEERQREFVKLLHDEGVRIHVGTDSGAMYIVPGVSMREEMRNLARAGLSIEDVWSSATAAAGRSLAVPGLGTIEVDSPADLLVFASDPMLSGDFELNPELIIADGRVYRRAELEADMLRFSKHFARPLFDLVSVAIARQSMAFVFGRKPN